MSRGKPKSKRFQTLIDEANGATVWAENFEEEMSRISSLKFQYNHIAVCITHPGNLTNEAFPSDEYCFAEAITQINTWPIIRVAFALFDTHGNPPKNQVYSKWIFNLKFQLEMGEKTDMAVNMLKEAGIDYQRHQKEGIIVRQFAEKLVADNFVVNDDLRWLTFKGIYDFGLLVKNLLNSKLPAEEMAFVGFFSTYFPKAYDLRYLMTSCKSLNGDLQQAASYMRIRREGNSIATKACLVGHLFFAIRSRFFEDMIEDILYDGHIYGIK